MATSDHLTGLFNRGYLDDRFAIELSRARRYGKQLSISLGGLTASAFQL
jgi:PleD family two-component response regulator